MYGKLPERKLKESDYNLSCEEVRRQLEAEKDTENRRVNIDSAKKLAVVQRMDYEGFRQMVLGANIFPAKSLELSQLMKNQGQAFDEKKKSETIYDLNRKIEGNSQKHCTSFRDFKKKFAKCYDKQLSWQKAEECYSILKEQNQSRLQKIFSLECEADILLKIVQVFKFIVEYLKSNEKKDESRIECGFMIKFLQIVLSITTMQDISLNILTKKQRERVALFLEECKIVLSSEEEEAIIAKVISLVRK